MPSRRNKPRTDANITRLTRLSSNRRTARSGIRNEDDTKTPATTMAQARNAPLCRFFVLNGNCRYGDGCAFSHTLPEGGVEEARKQIPCQFYARGTCKYGDYCQLRHDEADLIRSVETTYNCGICLEQVTKVGHKFGLLSCCPHVFCFECLMEWRKEGSTEAEDRRSCPTCRKHSDYVVPSNNFAVGEEKELIVSEYRAKLAVIPCKNFDGTLGSCVFGRDCFYAHLGPDGEDTKSEDESMQELHDKRMAKRLSRHSHHDDIDMLNSFLLLLDLYASSGFPDMWSDDEDGLDDDDDDYSNVD